MFRRRLDIPLDSDGSVRFLPWLIALMVYLAGLALAGTLVLNGALARYDRTLSGTLTVQLPPASSDGKDDGGLAAALQALRGVPGVIRAAPLGREETARLIEPWLGTSFAPEELALPQLVDLRIDPERPPDFAALAATLTAAAPGAVLDDNRQWLDRLATPLRAIEATTLAIVAFIGAVAALTVVFTTRAGLAVHHTVIEVLHLIGAQDLYIAAQFEGHALRLGLAGGLFGLLLAVATLFGIAQAAARTSLLGGRLQLLPSLVLAPWQWAVLALLPLAAGFIAMMTARLTVLRALARMP
jgi:cell division transport system permease protein